MPAVAEEEGDSSERKGFGALTDWQYEKKWMILEKQIHQIFWFSRREWEIIILYMHVRYVRLPAVLIENG